MPTKGRKRRDDSREPDDVPSKSRRLIFEAEESIFALAGSGDIEGLRKAVREDANRLRSHDDNGRSALYYATLHGKLDACRLLLEAGADPNQTAHDGETPLMALCHAKDIALEERKTIAQLLFKKGARGDLRLPDDKSCVMAALTSGEEAFAEWLLDKVELDVLCSRDLDGHCASHEAAHRNAHSFLRRLAVVAPQTLSMESGCGSPLMLAASFERVDAARAIVEGMKAAGLEDELVALVNGRRDRDNCTPTTVAIALQNLELSRLFLEAGGRTDIPLNFITLPSPHYCYQCAIGDDNDKLIELIFEFKQPLSADENNNPWVLCVQAGAFRCLRLIDRHLPRPSDGFFSVDWNHFLYIVPWAWENRRWGGDLSQEVSLSQLALREGGLADPSARANAVENRISTCVAAIAGEPETTLLKALKEEIFFSTPFATCREIQSAIFSRLKKWPFDWRTNFTNFRVRMDKHLYFISAENRAFFRRVMMMGLPFEVEDCPCCDSLSPCFNWTAQPPQIRGLNLSWLELLCSGIVPFLATFPMCASLRKALEALCEHRLSSVGSLSALCRQAIRRAQPVSTLASEDWAVRLPLPTSVKGFLLYSGDCRLEHFRR